MQFQRDNNMTQFVAGQYLYNAVGRDIEMDILRMGAELGIGLMAWSPLAGGLLTGKYDLNKLEDSDGRLSEGDFLQVSKEQAAGCDHRADIRRRSAQRNTCANRSSLDFEQAPRPHSHHRRLQAQPA